MRRVIGLACAASTLIIVSAAPVSAGNVILSQFGADNGTCGPANNPCRTLAQGVLRVDPGGTIFLEMPGDYGPATINKGLTIDGHSGGGIFAPAGPCITINAGNGNDVININGLTCDKDASAGPGIIFNTGHKLNITDSTIRGGTGANCGVQFQPNANAEINIRNSFIGPFGTAAGGGDVCVAPRSGADVIGVLDDLMLENSPNGVRVVSGAGSVSNLTVVDSVISGNGVGILSQGAGSTVRLKNNTITGNDTGMNRPAGGKLISLGGNSISGNTAAGLGFTSTVPTQ